MTPANSIDWQQRIQGWLREEDVSISNNEGLVHDYEFLISLSILQIAIIKPKEKNKILIACKLILPSHDQQAYIKLNENIRNNFILDLTKDLLLVGLVPQFYPPTPIVGLNSVEFSSTLFMDNFSKSKLFEEIDRIKRGYAILMINLEKHIPKFKPMDDSKLT